MALNREALNHLIEDDLSARNSNWDNLDTHLAKTVQDEGGVHGLIYEEGIWTPALTFNNASVGITYAKNVGDYKRIGNIVFCYLNLALSSKGTSTGVAIIGGLPFRIKDSCGIPLGEMHLIGRPTGGLDYIGIITENSMILRSNRSTTSSIDLDDTHFQNASRIRTTFVYEIA